jgi:hypothetical protein
MDCHDFERILIEEDFVPASRLPLEAEEHAMACLSCRDFVRFMRTPDPDETDPPPEMLNRVASHLEADLLPIPPIASARTYMMLLAGISMSIAAIGAYCTGAFALHAMSPIQVISVMCALCAGVSVISWSLAHLIVPGSRHPLPPKPLPIAIVVLLGLVLIASFRMRDQTRFWQRGWLCIQFGFLFAVLATAPIWLLLRRGVISAPRLTGTVAGLLAGLVGTSVLEIHCSNPDLAHILVFHVGVAILGAMGGFAVGLGGDFPVRYRGGRRSRRRSC